MYASKYYTHRGVCTFINVISKIDGNEYMMSIPSKYNVSVKEIKNNIFEINVEFSVSKLPVGSSAKINSGFIAIALAIATLCCSPPDN